MLALCTRLEEGGRLDEDDAADVARIRANAYTMLRRVQDMMLVARLENADLQLEAAVVDVAAVVRRSVEGFASVAAERSLTLQIDVPDRLPAVVDEEKVVSLVSNLVANAIRHAPGARSAARWPARPRQPRAGGRRRRPRRRARPARHDLRALPPRHPLLRHRASASRSSARSPACTAAPSPSATRPRAARCSPSSCRCAPSASRTSPAPPQRSLALADRQKAIVEDLRAELGTARASRGLRSPGARPRGRGRARCGA